MLAPPRPQIASLCRRETGRVVWGSQTSFHGPWWRWVTLSACEEVSGRVMVGSDHSVAVTWLEVFHPPLVLTFLFRPLPLPHPPIFSLSFVLWRTERHCHPCLLFPSCWTFWSKVLPGSMQRACFYTWSWWYGAWLCCCGLACSSDNFSLIECKECEECGAYCTQEEGWEACSGMQVLGSEMGELQAASWTPHVCPFWVLHLLCITWWSAPFSKPQFCSLRLPESSIFMSNWP